MSASIIKHFCTVSFISFAPHYLDLISDRNDSVLHRTSLHNRCCTFGSTISPSHDDLLHLLYVRIDTTANQCWYTFSRVLLIFIIITCGGRLTGTVGMCKSRTELYVGTCES